MLRKINILRVLFIFMAITSCKKENINSENERNPKQLQLIKPTVKEVDSDTIKPETPADGKYPIMTFSEKEFDFGEINQGDKVEHTFKFKNTGEADLIITNAKASCGCTVPEYPKNIPIKPGENGKIMVTFNSAGKHGKTTKGITVFSNTESGNELLNIKTSINVQK